MCKFSERIAKNNILIYNMTHQEKIMEKLEEKLQQLSSIFSSRELNLAKQIITAKSKEYNNLDDDIFQIVIKTIWELKENKLPLRKDFIIRKVTNDLSWAKEDLESLEFNKENPEYITDEINKIDLFTILKEGVILFDTNCSDELSNRNINIIIEKMSGVSIKKISKEYSLSENYITTMIKRSIHIIKLKCLKAYLSDLYNYEKTKSMLYNYNCNKNCEEHKGWRHSSASIRNIEDWASALSYHGKCTQQDELTYENICELASYVYQKKLPKKIS